MHASLSRNPLSRDATQILLHEADMAARRLTRRLHLPHADLEDVRQDLLADLIARLPAYDATRGSLGAFAGTILVHQASRIAGKVRRERRMFGMAPVSLDEPIPGSGSLTLGDLTSEADGLAAFLGQPIDTFAATEQRLDAERGLGALKPVDGALCAALSCTTINRLAASGQCARSSLYRRIKNIRLAWMAIGVAAA